MKPFKFIQRYTRSTSGSKSGVKSIPSLQESATQHSTQTSPKARRSIIDMTVQILDALQIGVHGIAITQVTNPMRKVVGFSEKKPGPKLVWNIEPRRLLQLAVINFEPKTAAARNQKAVILFNNPAWDNNEHPFSAESIPYFLQQLECLNNPYRNPGQIMQNLLALENKIIQSFYNELGPIDGRAAGILHTIAAKPSTARLMFLYAPDDAHDAHVSFQEEKNYQDEYSRQQSQRATTLHFGCYREDYTSLAVLSTSARKRNKDEDAEESTENSPKDPEKEKPTCNPKK